MTSRYHRAAAPVDAWNVGVHLRRDDANEVFAATGRLPTEVLLDAVKTYPAEAVVAPDGEVIALCGVTPLLPGVGGVWMVGTPAISRYRHLFISEGHAWLTRKFSDFRKLGNYVDARNRLHIRWLEHLGAQFLPAIPYGPFGLPFYPFEIITPNV